MMPVLIQGPKQPGNKIDVYLRPLVEELLQLWNGTGVRAWDEHMGEEFDLKALLFVTINDWPALSNLSGQTNKGYRTCTHCLDDTDSIIWLTVRRMFTWDIVDFFRASIPEERNASISKVRRITGRSFATVLVLMYMIWSRI